jgi:nicotinamidase/pyrazinamidase
VNRSAGAPAEGDALLIVDVQADFLPGGALAVSGGDTIIEPLNRCLTQFHRRRLPIIASRDHHPLNHCSFREQGGPWPPHCVIGTSGAAFAAGLALPDDALVVSKATAPETDAYSAFQHTGLAALLRIRHCRRLFIGGLATDYCVQATVLDALREGFEVVVLADAICAVNAQPGDGARAVANMAAAGARIANSDKVLS